LQRGTLAFAMPRRKKIAALHLGPVMMRNPGSALQSKRLAHQRSHLDRQFAPFRAIGIDMLWPFGPS
jgi:hypothetical protein